MDPNMNFSRLDFLLPYWKGGHVIIEVDEEQHSHISQLCETVRMNNVVTSWILNGNSAPIAWIRYNPHAYRNNGILAKTPTKERHFQLLKLLNEISFQNSQGVRVFYMFYDTEDGVPSILSDPDYNPVVKEWVVSV